jgi:hypothetical protein
MRRKRALQERETRRFGDAQHDGRVKDRVFDDGDKITTRLVKSVRSMIDSVT